MSNTYSQFQPRNLKEYMNIAVSSSSYYLIDSRKLALKATIIVFGCKIIYRFKNVI